MYRNSVLQSYVLVWSFLTALAVWAIIPELSLRAEENLIINGSFEAEVNVPTGNYRSVYFGDQSIEGWGVSSGRIDWSGTPWFPKDGEMSAQLVDNGSAIRQTFSTVKGQAYKIRFSLEYGYGLTPVTVAVKLGSSAYQVVIPAGPAYTWNDYSITLTADSESSILEFENIDGGQVGPFVDDVHVSLACSPAPAGVVSWWRGEGDASDAVGINNGAVNGNVSFAPGKVNSGFNLDGTSGFISVPNSPSLNPTGQISVEAWFKPVSYVGSGSDAIVEKGYYSHSPPYYQYHLGVTGNQYAYDGGSFEFSVANGGAYTVATTQPSFWAPGTWYHLAGTYDGNSIKIYVNGNEVDSQPASGSMEDYGGELRIGSHPNTGGMTPGVIDEVTIYNRALTSNEVARLFLAGAAGKCNGIELPSIIAQPQDLMVPTGGSASFGVTVVGEEPIGFQWRFHGTNLVNSSRISGSASSALAINSVVAGDEGSFQVIASNAYGSVTSVVARLTVLPSTHLDFGTANPLGWHLAAGVVADAPPYVIEGNILTVTTTGGGDGAFLPGGSADGFDGYWTATYPFFLPANATNVSLTFSNLGGDDRVVLTLNGATIAATGIGSVNGPNPSQGSMVLVDGQPLQPYLFTGENAQTSGRVTNGFYLGRTNVLRAILNNTFAGIQGDLVPLDGDLTGFLILGGAAYDLLPELPDCQTPLPGLVGWWRGEGSALDSVGTNHGTLMGGGYTNGMAGQAFSLLGGLNSFVDIGFLPNLDSTSEFTVMAWVKPAADNSEVAGIVGRWHEMG
ncbi:MAG: cell wall/surface repeat protein, partial [Verrucomicrobiales bacterium]|nr:cell wall/surface repeat protein [Verrucomicrobiales bacterium]